MLAKIVTAKPIIKYFAAMLFLAGFRIAIRDAWFDTRSTGCVAPATPSSLS
jgi:hypothetical protein